jgi:predicted secreted protein
VRMRAGWLLPMAIAFATAAPALAQSMAMAAPTVLHLTQTAETKVVRDRLRVEMRVEETGPGALAVQAAINRRMTAALNRARQVLGVDVETGSYEVGEEEMPHGPARWRGSQALILSGTAADAVLKLAGSLQSQGLLMSSMAYEVSPETVRGAEEDLTAEALAGLAQRTAAIAERLHLAVLGYRDLRVGNAETGTPPTPRFAMAMAMAKAMPPPVAAAGEVVIRLTVEAEVLLGPARSKTPP